MNFFFLAVLNQILCPVFVDAGYADLDIKRFTVTKSVKVGKDVRLKLEVRNEGNPDGGVTRPATIIGMQNGVQVFTETQQVH